MGQMTEYSRAATPSCSFPGEQRASRMGTDIGPCRWRSFVKTAALASAGLHLGPHRCREVPRSDAGEQLSVDWSHGSACRSRCPFTVQLYHKTTVLGGSV